MTRPRCAYRSWVPMHGGIASLLFIKRSPADFCRRGFILNSTIQQHLPKKDAVFLGEEEKPTLKQHPDRFLSGCYEIRRVSTMEAPPGFEPGNQGFADPRLTTWLWRQKNSALVYDWSGKRDSNPRHSPWQGDALPLSYSRIINNSALFVVEAIGIEPMTLCL